MDPTEPNWRDNSSYSPPPSRRWDCRSGSDGISHGTNRTHITGSSLSSHKVNARVTSSDQYQNHHHSASDGSLSYLGSPSDNFHVQRWMPPVQRYDLGEFSTPTGGARPGTSVFVKCNEKSSAAGVSPVSNSLDSASTPSDSNRWASTSKHPVFCPPRNMSGRRSFMSKPVYPLIFRNPVSEGEVYELAGVSNTSRMAPGDNNRNSPVSTDGTSSSEFKFHKTLTQLQRLEASPEPGSSSRRDGFRWSNASSYDFGFDGDTTDITEHIGLENLRSPNSSVRYQKCGLCGRLIWQKSPWSSHRIVRSGDMPVAGILPCRHVFHAECLEEMTPKGQIHEPPCPLCLKATSSEESASFSEPLHTPRRSLNWIHRANHISNGEGSSSNPNPDQIDGNLRRNLSLPKLSRGGSLMKNHFKKKFSFKGKVGKDLFGKKIFGRNENQGQSSYPGSRSRLSGS